MRINLLPDETVPETPGDISFKGGYDRGCDLTRQRMYKWLWLCCQHGQATAIALEPQRQGNGTSWVWNGSKERPTLNAGPNSEGRRSVDCTAGCGCHFLLTDGEIQNI